jgi:hypothetical protein
MVRDTGFPASDAENDFARQRRRANLSRLSQWMLGQPDDVNVILPFDEVLAALGKAGERRLGLQVIAVDSIVGSVDRTREFDRYFRPTSTATRERWQRLAAAQRRGEAVPPISVYRVGGMHFVVDGHHRVSIAMAMGRPTIDAYVTEVRTKVSPEGVQHRGDLLLKDHRRVFLERVPLAQPARSAVLVSDPWDYAQLAESVEAWGFRLMQDECRLISRREVAERWFEDEYTPVVRMAREAGMLTRKTDAELYMWLVAERYRMLRSHAWDENVASELASKAGRRGRRRPKS